MKKLYSFFPALLIAGFTALLISCAPEACFEETNSFLKASFYNNKTKKQQAPDSLLLFGLGQTNKIYNNVSGVQPALIPMNASAESCTVVIRINDVTDTIQFSYSSYPHLISKECGYTFYHRLDTFFCSKNVFYIYKSSNNITTANEENIRIFY